jgi:hypothetical protein
MILENYKNLPWKLFRLAVLLLFLAIAIPSSAEHLFLKDGSIINCKVIEETADQITIVTDNGKNVVYTQDKVLRVLYAELNMEKIYVQLKNGKSMRVYMVDEDRKTYTFRNDITKPEEFIINRSEVMFITERNPSGLKGEPELYSISLSWYQSFDKMEKFNIYIKNTQEVLFTLTGESKETSYVLKNLKSNTKYIIRVTGVDSENLETGSSNEIEILTKNLPPFMPEKGSYEKEKNGDYYLTWDKTEDSDGKVVNYIIYRLWNKKNIKLAETTETELIIKGPLKFNKLYVRAVDDMGAESQRRVLDEYIYKPPTVPGKALYEKLEDGNYQLKWGKSKGRIVKYIISKLYNNKKENIAETSATEILIEKPLDFENLYVRAVDNRDAESPDAIFDEIKNIIPTAPGNAVFEKLDGGNYRLKWDKSTDIDGRVVKYIILRLWNKKIEKFAESPVNELFTKISIAYEKLYVRAVDNKGDESPETVFYDIKNSVPAGPDKARFEKLKSGSVNLTWRESKERKEPAVKYNIYRVLKEKNEIISSPEKTAIFLAGPLDFDSLYISSIDKKGIESRLSKALPSTTPEFMLQVNPALIFPVGILGEMSSIGIGTYIMAGVYFSGFQTGFETGFFYFFGNTAALASGACIKRMMLVPLLLSFGYRFELPQNFSITPYISAGYAYMNINAGSLSAEYKDYHAFDPMMKLGVSAEYRINDLFSIGLGCDFGMIFEKTGTLMYISTAVNCIFRL